MRSMEFHGRTVDEAIFHGMNEMGLTIDEVEITTVQSASKGLFGLGAKDAIVRLTEREVKATPTFEKVERTPSERGERSERPRRDNNRRRPESSSDRPKRPARVSPEAEADMELVSMQYDYSEEYADELEAAVFLRELLEKMGIEATVSACEVDEGIRINMVSNTDGLLIGRRGETLDALQYLVSLYANKNRKDEGYLRITLDTEGYRARREATLGRLARRNASRAVKIGRPVAMDPMNPYERRVIHSALKDFRGVSTHSEGDEPNRRVIITPNR